ncbi:hypothetical protein SAMN05660745_01008 [Corynebacterium glucuronolyticum]|nr:hypothetical protein CGLUCO_02075 [Corynebacterium glucuronolyticum DSM 44120]SMB83681.1 hypothetical protein SAMN05660745_01008 [Corynebacterium glucuronolyticum]
MANARPLMEMAHAIRKTSDGTSRVKLWDRDSATAHTDSNKPETMRINQAITVAVFAVDLGTAPLSGRAV